MRDHQLENSLEHVSRPTPSHTATISMRVFAAACSRSIPVAVLLSACGSIPCECFVTPDDSCPRWSKYSRALRAGPEMSGISLSFTAAFGSPLTGMTLESLFSRTASSPSCSMRGIDVRAWRQGRRQPVEIGARDLRPNLLNVGQHVVDRSAHNTMRDPARCPRHSPNTKPQCSPR